MKKKGGNNYVLILEKGMVGEEIRKNAINMAVDKLGQLNAEFSLLKPICLAEVYLKRLVWITSKFYSVEVDGQGKDFEL